MPLSEFYKMARGRLESAQKRTTTCSTDLSHVPENEFGELVWENGQIMWQGQQSRARRSSTSINFQSQTPKLRDKDAGNGTNSKMGKLGTTDSIVNDSAAPVPSVEIGLEQEDDTVPWFENPFGSLQQDYCSELLTELSGVTANDLSAQNSFAPIDRRNSYSQAIRGSPNVPVHNGSSLELFSAPKLSSSEAGESSRSKSGQFYSWSCPERQSNTKQAICMESIQKQGSGMKKTGSSIMNFSYFSRPAALVRTNLQNISTTKEGMGGKAKGIDPSANNMTKSTLIDLSSGVRKDVVDLKPVEAKPLESRAVEKSEAGCQEDGVKEKLPNHDVIASKAVPDSKKNVEVMVASSSVCSRNGTERASNDPTHSLKRKFHETDESEGQSEDVEEESVGIRKAAPARTGAGSKRSRAAEVHNLSERRRRDRINEKMRALQELIPNCNKADKASMLDEAIEYLKTLQLQVQIMSMGAGLYMPPMMLPTALQHLHSPHMAHFSPLGLGMGMGMGFGMGMNVGSSGCPIIPAPPMQGAHFQGMNGPNFHVFGHPGQGLPMSMPQATLLPLSRGPPLNSAMGVRPAGRVSFLDGLNPVPPSNSKDLIQNANSQATNKDLQLQESSLVPNGDQAPKIGSSEEAKENEDESSGPGCD
ncbi:hypothetical protein NMG60_11021018 [Bertholletia excelsa]